MADVKKLRKWAQISAHTVSRWRLPKPLTICARNPLPIPLVPYQYGYRNNAKMKIGEMNTALTCNQYFTLQQAHCTYAYPRCFDIDAARPPLPTNASLNHLHTIMLPLSHKVTQVVKITKNKLVAKWNLCCKSMLRSIHFSNIHHLRIFFPMSLM